MRHSPCLRLGAVLVLAALTATRPIAQTPATSTTSQEQRPTFRVEANFVRVDVYPMKDGKPLPGLRVGDFELLEDGVPQRIEAFEHVLIRPAGPDERREPSSQRESLQLAANPRNRIFVVFLDTPNVSVDGSYRIIEPLIRLMDRILGPDDLVGIMTPEMAASQIVLARKTQVIEEGLRRNWTWGRRFSYELDERERAYEHCYPALPEAEAGQIQSDLAQEMIRRKRERATLEALQDTVRYLGSVREERKAIITVTEGWLRLPPYPGLLKLREDPAIRYREEPPGRDPVVVGPTGTLTTRDPRDHPDRTLTKRECDTDRMRLAMMDNQEFFRQIVEDANRVNASFYPVDPRGLVAFDAPLGPEKPPPLDVDRVNLRARLESLHDLALSTDGLAVVDHNNLDRGLRRIADDLTSYYLLGYYSTNTKLDGRYRRVTVKVRQPGVEVRARRGYRAATAEEAAAARRAAEAPAPAAGNTVTAALGSLARIRPDARFRISATALQGAPGTIWVAGEVPPGDDAVTMGGSVDVEASAGGAASTARVVLKPGERAFLATLKAPAPAAEQISVRARLTSDSLPSPLTESIQVDASAGVGSPVLFRRGPSTGNRLLPAADYRFSRTERLRLELPVTMGVSPGTGRVLDRAGQPLQIPVALTVRSDEATGQQWIAADLALAPLAPSDYALEVTATTPDGEQRIVTAIRVGR